MKVVYFSKTSEIGPGSRYRIYQFVPDLRASGVSIEISPLFGPFYFRLLRWKPSGWRLIVKCIYVAGRFAKRSVDLLILGKADMVVLEGQLFPYMGPTVERILAKRYKVVIEFDDAIYLTSRHETKIPALLQLSSGAIVGNRTLAQYARSYTPNVYVVPTVIDTKRFKPTETFMGRASDSPNAVITIGWIGLAYNAAYLEWLAPIFRHIQKKHNLSVRIISSKPPLLDGVNIDFRLWRYETEVHDLQTCQIGVMPLPNDEWAKGKCGLKLLQYMAVGLPSVASPIGVNQEIITDGEDGFLASTQEEWCATLIRLCQDTELRVRMGQAARKTVETEYSLSVWGPRLADRYREIIK